MKYATVDEAEGAIRALTHQYTFPGVSSSEPRMIYLKPLAIFGQFYICVFSFFPGAGSPRSQIC